MPSEAFGITVTPPEHQDRQPITVLEHPVTNGHITLVHDFPFGR